MIIKHSIYKNNNKQYILIYQKLQKILYKLGHKTDSIITKINKKNKI